MKKAKRGIYASLPSKYLPDAQLKILLQFVRTQADLARETGATRAVVDELIVLLLTGTGIRPREFCNLRIRDLHLQNGENTVCVPGANGGTVRQIDISSTTANSLRRFVNLYRKDAKPNDPLLISERGNQFTYMSLYSKVKKIGQKAEIGKLHPYMLRRTFMVKLYDARHDLRLVQQQAGHANIKTTAIYAKTGNDHRQQNDDANLETANERNDSIESARRVAICEGCGKSIFEDEGTRIDSGQLLCCECIKYFRG